MASSASPSKKASTTPPPGCSLKELTQYHCSLQYEPKQRIVCQPIDRIFRVCAGRPSLEVTHLVKYDEEGRAGLEERFWTGMPQSHHWHELKRH